MKRTVHPLFSFLAALRKAKTVSGKDRVAGLKWLLYAKAFLLLLPAVLEYSRATAQMPQILKDIRGEVTWHSTFPSGYNFTGINGTVFFPADDGIHGNELWKSDGTEAGTVMLKDINPGTVASTPEQFIVYNNLLFFSAQTAANGFELWKSDGTEAGTVMVKDIFPGTSSGSPNGFAIANGILFFQATNSLSTELWRTDGTEAGTVLVKDISPGNGNPQNLTNVNGVLFFSATNGAGGNNGVELWKSDGTEAGTVMVKDINPGIASSSPGSLTAVGGLLYFTANDGSNGIEVWRSDGTEAGTFLLRDINPGTLTSSPQNLRAAGGLLYFSATNGPGVNGVELWRSDGTEAGTYMLRDINPGSLSSNPQNLTVIGNTVFFTAGATDTGLELWKSDGTEAGTALVKDIFPGGNGSQPQTLVNINDTLFFTAISSGSNRELWKSDGTEAGTVLVKDINPGAAASNPSNLAVTNNTLYFTATSAGIFGLWKSDGTEAGTTALNTEVVSGGVFATLYGHDGKLYFMYNGFKPGIPSTATGREPWVSDGTNAGTKLLKDINITTEHSEPADYCRVGNTVFFRANDGINGAELWKSNGTETGTMMVKDIFTGVGNSFPSSLISVNNTLYFAATAAGLGTELWKSDGTEAGTVLVKDIAAGAGTSSPAQLTPAGGYFYFTIFGDRQLWKSDGTEAGTVMIVDFINGVSPFLRNLTNVNGLLFFTAGPDAGTGTELWKSDGTEAGTVMVKDIWPGNNSSNPGSLTALDGKLFFRADDGINGIELWVSDGTESGTVMVKDIAAGAGASNPSNLAAINGKLYFTAFTFATQYEPWISDGTPAGTYMITEIVPGSAGSLPSGFTGMNGLVYFAANGPGTGRELWETDGTAIGTQLVKDINTGSGDSNPELLTVAGHTLFFRATMPVGGVEFFKSDGTAAGTTGYDLFPSSTGSNPDHLTALNDMLLFTATHQVYGREIWKAVAAPTPPPSSFSIAGDTVACNGDTVIYSAVNVLGNGITYHWSLPDGGGTLNFADSIATVTWNGSGNRSVQLYLSNSVGNSQTKTRTVVVDSAAPTAVPVISNFARTLSASTRPAGTYVQWYRNDTAILNATDTFYYAALAGNYTAKFSNHCGPGPASNTYSFPANAIAQTITFPHTPNQSMAPALKIKLPATASSNLPVFYTRLSGPGTVTQDSLSITGVGTIIVKAQQPGDDFYSAATPKNDTIIVIKGNQVIDFAPIPGQVYRVNKTIPINPTSSVGLSVAQTIVSGFATVSENLVWLTGAGNITVRATQAGNANYNPATPVDRTFCVGIDTLPAIVGATTACLGTYTYTAQKIAGANYVWTLSGGGSMVTGNDTAFVTWNTSGTHTLKVKANSSCNATYSFEPQKFITINNVTPTPVTNMFPVNNSQNQSLPLNLSWVPGDYTETYDLYVWDSAQAQPGVPYKTNIAGISYTIPQSAFAYNNAYKWRLVSKNPCNQVSGPIQNFRLVPLPDLQVTGVVAPASAISGQTITINWTIRNNGPGNTPANGAWQDAVYLSFDTMPNFSIAPEIHPAPWSVLNFPVRALLLGTRNNVTALQSGQQYSNSINFTIPISYSLPLYAYVITNIGNNGIVEVTRINDTARSQNPINITLAPTPDLRVDSMFTPSATFSGSTVNVAYKVKNYGSLTPVGASWQDNAYLSQSILFDSATAIRLNNLTPDGSYYPNTTPAGVTVNTQLQHDSFYYRDFTAVIPNNIFGAWFLHVKTNNNGSLYEGPSFNNNTNNNAIQVYLTPTPQLKINSLTLPVTQASTTQPIGINWNILNTGFNDNIERNRAHYYTKISNCDTSGTPGMILNDSASFGGSYWKDRVYISTDSTGLIVNQAILLAEAPHGIQNSGLYIYQPLTGCIAGTNAASYNKNTQNVINPNANFPGTATFNVPHTLQTGTYYIYVWANATKTVFEYPGTPEIKRTGALIIQRPDAVVSSISSPANAVAGQQIQIGYSISNNGPGAVFNHIRRDSIYISNSAVFNASAVLIGANIFTEDLPVGSAVPHSFNYTPHPSQSGTRYFFVRTNVDSAFRETNYANNVSAASATVFAPAAPVDFVVTNVQATDTVITAFASKIHYAVANNGVGAATGTWMDSLYVSCNPVYGQSSAYYIGRKQQTRTVASGGNYTDSFSLNIPFTYTINSCFTQIDFNNGYFFVKANANGGVYEGAANNNNVLGSSLKVLDNPLVDHIVTTVNGADSATVGQTYNMSWIVKNIGRNPIIDYDARFDSIYVSADSVLNSNAVKTSRYKWTNKLEHNETKTLTTGFNMVNVPTGNYYVFVKTNASTSILAEKNYSNNVNLLRGANGAAKTIYIFRPQLPDLIDSIISAPAAIASGQPATIIYRITNIGLAPTTQNFYHLIRLSNDLAGNSTAAQLSFKTVTARLQPGQFFTDTVQVMIPVNLAPRVYTLFAKADDYNLITESDEDNNSDINFMTVFRPDSTDLLVIHITAPDTVMLGYKMDSARWVLKNNSGVIATGSSSDGIYLSQANELDSTATLIGIKTRVLNLPPLDTVKMSLAPMVTGVTEGSYNMFVSTDLVNQLPELDETNNTGISTGQVYVKVKELQLDVVENNTLFTDTRFYKLVIPDSLNGATISVKLTTGDSLTRINQMFIGYGYVPTAAHFDYTYPNASYGNQEIVMAYTYAGTYYISIRTINPGTVTQNISLLAKKLPFAIANVHTNSGGNIGNVTIRISGSLFTPGMTAKLNKPGTEIIASAVYFTNTTVVYATFNLQGKPLGIYDVTLSKADTAFTVLASGFSVVPANNGGVISGGGNNTGSGNGNEPGCDPGAASGLNSQLQTELLVPAIVMRGWPFVIQINYNNPTNFDLPAQVRTLFAENIIKIAFTPEGVNNGVQSLTMELTEPGGPPGIIRAGGSGTIFIYGKSDSDVPGHTITLFKLQ